MNQCVENAINQVMRDYKKSLLQPKKNDDFRVDDAIIEDLILEIQPKNKGDENASA